MVDNESIAWTYNRKNCNGSELPFSTSLEIVKVQIIRNFMNTL